MVIIVGQFCRTSAASLTYGDEGDSADFARSSLVLLDQVISRQAGVTPDFTRVYGSGHSLGSNTIQTLCNAAVASTSFPNPEFTAPQMPCYLIVGQSDISEPLPDPRARDLVKAPWDTSADSAIYNWVSGAQAMNGLVKPFVPNSHKSFLAACSSYNESGRYYTYTWNNSADIPLVRFTRTLAREHNWLAPDGTRSYSASAFESADSVLIIK